MFLRTFHPRQFLQHVYGTEPFLQYCQSRGIAFEQVPGWLMNGDDYPRWLSALSPLSEPEQARIELELAQVNEVSHPDAIAQLVEAARERGLPSDSIPGDTALALWFFLHYPELFHTVFLHQEIEEVDAWRTAKAPVGIALDDLKERQAALAENIKDFYRVRGGTGRFCAVDAFQLEGAACCFVAHLSDRLRLFDVFTEKGERTTQRARLAFEVIFIYYPADGRLLLKARQRSTDKILDLFQRFGRAVLGVKLDVRSLAPAFRLDVFKRRFDPLPDAGDMEMVRVKALHLVYPGRSGRRRVKLETLSADDKFAILDLLHEHGGSEGIVDQLDVLYAELQVKLKVAWGSKNYLVRLWPDRCSLNQTPIGERLSSCLKRWGIAYAI